MTTDARTPDYIFTTPDSRFDPECLTGDEALALFGAVLAQCEDIHVVSTSLNTEQCEAGERLFNALNDQAELTPLGHGLLVALGAQVADLDHHDLEPEQWDALEALHVKLSRMFDHTPRNGDGELL